MAEQSSVRPIPRSITGRQLYGLLPEFYRSSDNTTGQNLGDLGKYLDSIGVLLDQVRATLDQRLADSFPDNPGEGCRACQEWLIPYFGKLLDVRLVSPEADGRRDEVANAVAWRQRKGTIAVVEQIAESVGQIEVEVQEGWKRVVMTPKINMPLLPAKSFGISGEPLKTLQYKPERHPGLPATTPDFRTPSRAVVTESTNPAANTSRFSGEKVTWRQLNGHGAPCFPQSYEDVSRRTVDTRTAAWDKGHFHPKRLLLHYPEQRGIFPYKTISLTWEELDAPKYEGLVGTRLEGGFVVYYLNSDYPVEITGDVILEETRNYRFEGIRFKQSLIVRNGRLVLRNVEAKFVRVDTQAADDVVLDAMDCLFDEVAAGGGPATLDSCSALTRANFINIKANNCIFMGNLNADSGEITFSRIPDESGNTETITIANVRTEQQTVTEPAFFSSTFSGPGHAALTPENSPDIYSGADDGGELGYYHHGRKWRPVTIESPQSFNIPTGSQYRLEDLIFSDNVTVTNGILYATRTAFNNLTINSDAVVDDHQQQLPILEARDCLFNNLTVASGLARLEYCTVLHDAGFHYIQASEVIFSHVLTITSLASEKYNCVRYSRVPDYSLFSRTNTNKTPIYFNSKFGETGCAVLHPSCHEAITNGAEESGEIGVYHNLYYCLLRHAMLDKINDFLPVGIEAVLIPDDRLNYPPPKLLEQNN